MWATIVLAWLQSGGAPKNVLPNFAAMHRYTFPQKVNFHTDNKMPTTKQQQERPLLVPGSPVVVINMSGQPMCLVARTLEQKRALHPGVCVASLTKNSCYLWEERDDLTHQHSVVWPKTACDGDVRMALVVRALNVQGYPPIRYRAEPPYIGIDPKKN